MKIILAYFGVGLNFEPVFYPFPNLPPPPLDVIVVIIAQSPRYLACLLLDLLLKKCSNLNKRHSKCKENQVDCKAGSAVKGQNLSANISTSRASTEPVFICKGMLALKNYFTTFLLY